MVKILFVCHGNICRSPMAHFIFAHMAKTAGRSGEFVIESAATSTEELGNGTYPPARRKLYEEGIPVLSHVSVQMTKADYDYYDYLIGMDTANIRNMQRIADGDPEDKIYKLLAFTDNARDVADPWYTGDFDATYRDVVAGCEGFLAFLKQEGQL